MKKIIKYFFWIGSHLSLFINALAGGRAYESVCARAYRIFRTYRGSPLNTHKLGVIWAYYTIRFTNLFEKDHCRKAWLCNQAVMAGLKDARAKGII